MLKYFLFSYLDYVDRERERERVEGTVIPSKLLQRMSFLLERCLSLVEILDVLRNAPPPLVSNFSFAR